MYEIRNFFEVLLMDLIPKKIEGGLTLTDFVIAGVLKYGEEKIQTGIIGNGTLMSGGIKLVESQIAKHYVPMIGKQLEVALIVDGVEDIITSVMGGIQNTGNPLSGLLGGGNNNATVEVI